MAAQAAFHEINVTTNKVIRWTEVNVNTGGSASTLQDIKIPDKAGGFSYSTSGDVNSCTANRFIYWRCIGDCLELIEESMDYELRNNHLRLKFLDTPILNGANIYEYGNNVIILVATLTSVHRILFPHPSKFHMSQSSPPGYSVPSIFIDASLTSIHDTRNTYFINESTSTPCHAQIASAWLNQDGEAIFVFATTMGTILIIRMPSLGVDGVITVNQLTNSSIMQRLFTGIIPAAIRGSQESADSTTSLCLLNVLGIVTIVTLNKDYKLRLWSTKTNECCLIYDLLAVKEISLSSSTQKIIRSGHVVKTITDSPAPIFAAYINLIEHSMIVMLEVGAPHGTLQLAVITSLSCGNDVLVDFSLTTNRIWLLCTDKSGHPVIKTATWNMGGDKTEWVEVFLDLPFTNDIVESDQVDARQYYSDIIFYPGRFSIQDINKALLSYRKSADSLPMEHDVTLTVLRHQVTRAIEDEIQLAVGGMEIPEDEYVLLTKSEWSKFLSCCNQYQKVGTKVKGLMVDNRTGLICIIKKGCVSYVIPCQDVERWFYSRSLTGIAVTNVEYLLTILGILDDTLPQDLLDDFDYGLQILDDPRMTASRLIHEFFSLPLQPDASAFARTLEIHLKSINNLSSAIQSLHRVLDLYQNDDIECQMTSDADTDLPHHLLASSQAVQVLTRCLSSFLTSRWKVTRALVLLETIVTSRSMQERISMSKQEITYLSDILLPESVTLLQAYFTMKHLNNFLVTQHRQVSPTQLAALQITESSSAQYAEKNNIDQTVMSLFIKTDGGADCRKSLLSFYRTDNLQIFGDLAVQFSENIAKLIWPLSNKCAFLQFLLSSQQYLCIQTYCHLIQMGWCSTNISTRSFFLGLSLLASNEPYKATDCFIEAANGLGVDECLTSLILTNTDIADCDMKLTYYMKIVEFFEKYNVYDCVITLAQIAIDKAHSEDSISNALLLKVFKYNMELGHYSEAYDAMIKNPDPDRRKDCLNQFIFILCEKKQFDLLITFPYMDIQDQVVDVLETKARSVDLTKGSYYHLLYAFHVNRENFRQAGRVKYEQAHRLALEPPSIDTLRQQAECYITAINCLQLVDEKYAWVIKPTIVSKQSADVAMELTEPSYQGEQYPTSQTRIEVVELKEIQSTYLLIRAMLCLSLKDKTLLNHPVFGGASEIVGLLVNAGLYDRAIIISQAFSLPLNPVVESLASRCIAVSQQTSFPLMTSNDRMYTDKAFDWLAENSDSICSASKESADISDQAWSLLQNYLLVYDKSSELHRSVTLKLLNRSFPLPSWLITSYKRRNPAELLSLYLRHDLLTEAIDLCLELIEATTDCLRGLDSSTFGLSGVVSPSALRVWLPYTSIDQLLFSLKSLPSDDNYTKLKKKVDEYQTHLETLHKSILPGVLMAR